MWAECLKISQELIPNIAKLNARQRDELSKSLNDSISQFMEEKFIEGSEKIKKVNEIVKDKFLNP